MENTFIKKQSQPQQQNINTQGSPQMAPQHQLKIKDPNKLTPEQEVEIKKSVVHALVQESHAGWEYTLMLVLSVLITTLGLIEGSASVVIGGMLLAPLMTPILALGLSLITGNRDSSFRSGLNILKSIGIILVASTATAFVFGAEYDLFNNFEILDRTDPTLLFMYIAVLSGVGAAYTWAKPHLSARLPGIAVAVALVPPLCVTGVGISLLSREIILGSFQLFIVNLLGIAGSSAIVFAALGFYQMKYVEKQEIKVEKAIDEQKKLEEEKKKQEEAMLTQVNTSPTTN